VIQTTKANQTTEANQTLKTKGETEVKYQSNIFQNKKRYLRHVRALKKNENEFKAYWNMVSFLHPRSSQIGVIEGLLVSSGYGVL